jgi:hypothetical protein
VRSHAGNNFEPLEAGSELLHSIFDFTHEHIILTDNNSIMAISGRIIKGFSTAKVAKSLKQRLSKLVLPWSVASATKQENSLNSSYESLPAANPHQEEVDDNALNEALEARLMELIASSPAQQSPLLLTLSVVPSDPEAIFNFDLLPQYQTRCQDAEAQAATTAATN